MEAKSGHRSVCETGQNVFWEFCKNMKVICAGLSKTGTKSVASALTILGYKVHDGKEHFQYHLDEYLQALEGKNMPDFAAMYVDVDAVTDVPACLFWKEILDAFPDAKVVLMVRDSEDVWLKSLSKTLAVMSSSFTLSSSLWMKLTSLYTPTGRKRGRCYMAIERKFYQGATVKANGRIISDAARKRSYTEHNARVQSSIPRDQLLVYNVKQGWQPLCEFLGVEVPDVPFPRLNVNSELVPRLFSQSPLNKRMQTELVLILSVITLIVALVVYLVFN